MGTTFSGPLRPKWSEDRYKLRGPAGSLRELNPASPRLLKLAAS